LVLLGIQSLVNVFSPIYAFVCRRLGISNQFSIKKSISLENIPVDSVSQNDASGNSSLVLNLDRKIEVSAQSFSRIHTLRSSTVDLKAGHAFVSDYSVIEETSNWPVTDLVKGNIPRPFLIPSEIKTDGLSTYIPSTGFYHWLIEDLPPVIRIVEEYKIRRVEIYDKAPAYLLDFLSRFEIAHRKHPRFSRFDSIVVPERIQNVGNANPDDMKLLRSFFLKNSLLQVKREKLYVSRRLSSRSPKFEKNLEEYLANIGWHIVYLEKLDLFTQVALFKSASAIIGVHGAGLSGMVFCEPDIPVIELFPLERDLKCFENLAKSTGQNFERIPFKADSSEIPEQLKFLIGSF
jgi:hypothetical protein